MITRAEVPSRKMTRHKDEITGTPTAHAPGLMTSLVGQGYTHASWKCTGCGLKCARGFQLLRIRGKLATDATISSIARQLRCPRCFRRPDPGMLEASKGRGNDWNVQKMG
jgi:hypothetical protein